MSPKLYDSLAYLWRTFSPPEEYAEEAETFRRRIQRHGIADGATILHLGSGGGSLDHELKRWYQLVGVDLSPAMIAQAQRLNPEVEYVCGDMRDVRLGRRFPAVLVHDAISYMTTVRELEQVYRTAAEHLDSGGLLLALPEELRERLAARGASASTHRSGDLVLSVMETSYDPDPTDHEYESVYVFLIRRGNALEVEVDRHRQGVFELGEFLSAIRSVGFRAEAERWELTDWGDEPELPLMVAVKE